MCERFSPFCPEKRILRQNRHCHYPAIQLPLQMPISNCQPLPPPRRGGRAAVEGRFKNWRQGLRVIGVVMFAAIAFASSRSGIQVYFDATGASTLPPITDGWKAFKRAPPLSGPVLGGIGRVSRSAYRGSGAILIGSRWYPRR
jgi:hypothetical protein